MPFLPEIPFQGLSPLQLLWVQYKQLGDALRDHNGSTANWLLHHMLDVLQELHDEQSEPDGDPQEGTSLGYE